MLFQSDQPTIEHAARKISLLLLDVDGVLTDGKLYFTSSGEEMKAFSTLDGHGVKMLIKSGIDVGIITGRNSTIVSKRAADLGIRLLYQGREDKLNVLHEILGERQLNAEQIAYAGDDFPDLPVMKAVGLSFSVPTGHQVVCSAAHAITSLPAGQGAVREICDFILHAQDKFQLHLE